MGSRWLWASTELQQRIPSQLGQYLGIGKRRIERRFAIYKVWRRWKLARHVALWLLSDKLELHGYGPISTERSAQRVTAATSKTTRTLGGALTRKTKSDVNHTPNRKR